MSIPIIGQKEEKKEPALLTVGEYVVVRGVFYKVKKITHKSYILGVVKQDELDKLIAYIQKKEAENVQN